MNANETNARRFGYLKEETATETYVVCRGDEYKEEDGENNVIAETTDESEAKEIALNESRENGCAVSVVRMSDKTAVLVISDSIGLAPEAAAAYDALCSSFVDTYQPKPTNSDNTPATDFSELSHAETIARRIEAMEPRGAWNNGVKQYALMLLDWYETEANESPLTLETMLNGAKDWKQYARGGAGVAQCYNARIAETLCSPSELKRNNHGAKMPNRFEDWQDIEARALFQAWRLITEAETLVNCNA